MRRSFSDIFLQLAVEDPRMVLLSGDLGYAAFEELVARLGWRFINTGVAEQTAVGIAAGLAHRGFRPFWYSIAPFAVFRPLEQIRLDLCLHNLPVCVVGNGGGYGYGIMGATHHALEDLACMGSLPNMTCYIPAYLDEVEQSVQAILRHSGPAYLRLGAGPRREPSPGPAAGPFVAVQRVESPRATLVGLGPLVHEWLACSGAQQCDVFALTRLPLTGDVDEFLHSVDASGRVFFAEEHVAAGGPGASVAAFLMERGRGGMQWNRRSARGYPGGTYGTQSYHRAQNGLDAASLGLWLEHSPT
jgi:transketolase